jgi:hypothetical protein
MTATTILGELKQLGRDNYRRILLNHGAKEPCFGVKIEDLKKIQKRIKKDYPLALALYDTGVYDAMYLAGLIADASQMTKRDLRHWAEKACGPLAGSTIPWVAAGSRHARELALEWIDSKRDLVAAAGWGTLSSLVSIKDDAELNLAELKRLLRRVRKEVHQVPDAVRYQMNAFIIAVGGYVRALTDFCKEIGEQIGPLTVDMGDTACQVPFAPDYIRKIEERGTIGKKRKTAIC